MLQVIPDILRRCPELTMAVDISLDGLGAAHDAIRGGAGIFEKAVRTFREIKKLQASQPRLQTGVIIAAMKSNQDDLLKIYDFVRDDLGPDSISVALVRGTPLDRGEKDVDLAKYGALVKRLSEDLVKDGLKGFRKTIAPGFTIAAKIKMHEEILKIATSGYQSPCYAAALNVVIYSNGDVYPCEILGVEKKIGNLREFGFDFGKLWGSPRRSEIQKWVVDSRCNCTHECHVPINLLFNPARLPALVRQSMKLP
jgi:radical SAM protein with 4Fe4S-binding SPASM domain